MEDREVLVSCTADNESDLDAGESETENKHDISSVLLKELYIQPYPFQSHNPSTWD